MFRTFTTALFLLFISIYVVASAPNIHFGKISKEELEMKYYHQDSSASAVVLGDFGDSRFTYNQHKGIQIMFTRHTRIKILNTNGYSWADVEIPVYHDGQDQESVSQIKGYTYYLDKGKVVKAKLKNVGKFTEKRSEHWDVVKFTMPHVKEGAVIEYTYTVVSDFLFNLQDWEFQRSIPVVWSEYQAKIPEYFYYKQLFQGYHPLAVNESSTSVDFFDFIVKSRTGGGGFSEGPVQSTVKNQRINFKTTLYRWAAQDVPALVEEPYITTLDDYKMKMKFELASTQFPGEPARNYTTTWEKIDQELLEDAHFGDVLKQKGGLKSNVEALTKSLATPEEKLIAIYNFVRDHIEWNGTSSWAARQSMKRTLEEKSGNSAEINLLLAGMLREAGITTDPVLLSTRDHGMMRQDFPMLNQFNYVIAWAKIGDNQYLLDATELSCPFNLLPVRCLNGQGRIVNEERGEKWINLTPNASSSHFVMVNLSLDQDQHLVGKVSNSRVHYDALMLRHKIRANHNIDNYIASVKENSYGWDILQYQLQDVENLHSPVKEEYEVKLTDHYRVAGDLMYLNPIVSGRVKANPFKLKERLYPVDFAYPNSKIYMLNLSLPEGYSLEEVPESTMIALPNQGGVFTYAVKVMGNTVQIVSKLEIKKSRFYAEEYTYVRKFFDLVVAKQGEQLVLRKSKE